MSFFPSRKNPIGRVKKQVYLELEADFQTKLIAAIKDKYGDSVWMYKAHDAVTVGIPDLIICFFGHFVAIELKRDGIKVSKKEPEAVDPDLTKMQRYNIMKINGAGGSAFVGRRVMEVMEKLDRIQAVLEIEN